MVGVVGGGDPVRKAMERWERVGLYPGSWYVEDELAVDMRATAGVTGEK